MTFGEFKALWEAEGDFIPAYTSGSTGEPKSINLAKHDMIISARATNDFFGLNAGKTFVCPMDFRYIGARMMYIRSIVCPDSTLIQLFPSNKFRFEGIADLLAIVPSQIDSLLNDTDMAKRARNVIIGGAPLDKRRIDALVKTGINAYTTYGMTETCSHVALSKVGSDVYTSLDGITFEIDNRGCLIINMPGRYTDCVVTNDLVQLNSPTQFKWLGRFDDIINSGGLKINPKEIETIVETVLRQIRFDFSDIVVFGIPSKQWGREAVCLIETSKQIPPDLELIVKSLLPDHRKCPKKFVAIDSLKRNDAGKISRTLLSKWFCEKL